MINPRKKLFRWGPIPGRLIAVSHWTRIYHWYPGKLHYYLWPEGYVIFYKNKMLFIDEMKKLEIVGEKVFSEIILTRKLTKFRQAWKKSLINLLSFCKKINKEYLRKLSDEDLQKEWQKFNDLIYLFWEPGIVPELAAYGAVPVLKRALEKERLDSTEKIKAFSILGAPVRLSFYKEEERDLLKLMKKFHSKLFKELIEKHQEKYFWISNSYFRTRVLDEAFFLNRIKQVKKSGKTPDRLLREMDNRLKTVRKNKLKILAKLKNKNQIKKISDGLSYCIWWQDQRKKYIFQYLHFLDLFVQEFAKRSKLPSKIFNFAWPEEVLIKPSKYLVNLLKKRGKDYFVVHFSRNKKRCYYRKKAKKIYKIFWIEKEILKGHQLKGLVVYSTGKTITGKVCIVRRTQDIENFPKGRILVTSMTSPDYITAIRKAKAIVTDTGGITCHAAIVSRELKIPCIVGTKSATKLLKDGDRVEVDADEGIVKKIK